MPWRVRGWAVGGKVGCRRRMMKKNDNWAPAIVAVKPTNKAGQPAAELVEPRAGAEGNVSQQSTGRAQYRGTVSQALKRIRHFVGISRRAVTHPRGHPHPHIDLVPTYAAPPQ